MSAQQFDMETVDKLQKNIEVLRNVFGGIKPAFEQSLELANSTGSSKMAAECESGLEAADTVVKQAEELFETLEKVIKYYKDLDEALN